MVYLINSLGWNAFSDYRFYLYGPYSDNPSNDYKEKDIQRYFCDGRPSIIKRILENNNKKIQGHQNFEMGSLAKVGRKDIDRNLMTQIHRLD